MTSGVKAGCCHRAVKTALPATPTTAIITTLLPRAIGLTALAHGVSTETRPGQGALNAIDVGCLAAFQFEAIPEFGRILRELVQAYKVAGLVQARDKVEWGRTTSALKQ